MSKERTDKSRPFASMNDHLDAFQRVVFEFTRTVIKEGHNPTEALRNLAILLDSAHFNLVSDFEEDPLKAVMNLMQRAPLLGQALLQDPEIGPKLSETGFEVESFAKGLVAQLHLNQNIGPISFTVPGMDYNADIHNPVESIGTIDNVGFVTLVRDFGFGSSAADEENADIVILAEQKKPVSPGGLQTLYQAAKDCPDTAQPPGISRVQTFIDRGTAAIERWRTRNETDYHKMSALLTTDKATFHRHYAYLAGRFGVPHLIDHIKRRAYHHLMAAQVDPDWTAEVDKMPFEGVIVSSHPAEDLIIRKGTSLREAKEGGKDKCYIIIRGSVIVKTDSESVEIPPGIPFGEAMFLSGYPRNADVRAGPHGADLVEISARDFWSLYKLFAPFQERVDARMAKYS